MQVLKPYVSTTTLGYHGHICHFLCYFLDSYSLENGICHLVLCEKTFSKRLAFGYLEDIQTEFNREYGGQVATATRPYFFIEFGMQKFLLLIIKFASSEIFIINDIILARFINL